MCRISGLDLGTRYTEKLYFLYIINWVNVYIILNTHTYVCIYNGMYTYAPSGYVACSPTVMTGPSALHYHGNRKLDKIT